MALNFYRGRLRFMNTAINESSRERLAIERVRDQLYELYRRATGKEPAQEVLWAEAEDFVARYGPDANLKELF
jgi:hypothetical protein